MNRQRTFERSKRTVRYSELRSQSRIGPVPIDPTRIGRQHRLEFVKAALKDKAIWLRHGLSDA
jgi:hypothetical protein